MAGLSRSLEGSVAMIASLPRLSLVCPAYEEEDALPAFHQVLLRVLEPLGREYAIEILYVDDGSRDGTLALLRRWAREDRRVRYLSLSRNFGHQAAITAGLEYTRGDVIITLDSDLQHPPDLIPVLLARWKEGHDIVLTIRAEDPGLGWFKRFSSQWFYTLMRWFSDTETRPAAADFRLMSRKAVDALLRLRESHRFLRGMVQWLGFPAAEVPYQPARRVAGASKYHFRKMLAFACDAVFSFSSLPLRLSAFLGLALIPAGLGLGLCAAVRALLGASAGTLLILAALASVGGAVLGSLGIIGEYVGRIYEQVKGRPIYLLKETDADGVAGRQRLDSSGPAVTAA
jgi:dolichol-phosphate mannosyltransferase